MALEGHQAGLVAAAFSADSRALTAASDREIWQWSATSGEGSVVATIDCDPIELKYTGTAGHAAIACADGTARILEIESGRTQVFQ